MNKLWQLGIAAAVICVLVSSSSIAPWMTVTWCENTLSAQGIDGRITNMKTVPFGREVTFHTFSEEEELERQQQGIAGGYGAIYYISCSGSIKLLYRF